ncbi:MAG: TonB family protein [Nitrospiraceae bacterium]|nr:TonB family protein [Nitrospiraceae bacterium]
MKRFSKFLIISILFHVLVFLGLLYVIKHQKPPKKEEPFVARLVTPGMLTPPRPVPRETAPPPRKTHAQKIPAEPYRRLKLPPLTREEEKNMPLNATPSAPEKPGSKSPRPLGHIHTPGHIRAPKATTHGGLNTPKGPISQKPGYEGTNIPKGTNVPGVNKQGRSRAPNLFPQDVIAKEAAKSWAKDRTDEGKDPNSITFSTREFRYYGYMQRLREKIEGIWVYPRRALEKRLTGDLYIRFTIRKDGSLGDVQILKTSGYPILDEAALKALHDAQPFWPIPDAWKMDAFTIEGHFVYMYEGLFLR